MFLDLSEDLKNKIKNKITNIKEEKLILLILMKINLSIIYF